MEKAVDGKSIKIQLQIFDMRKENCIGYSHVGIRDEIANSFCDTGDLHDGIEVLRSHLAVVASSEPEISTVPSLRTGK
jgi:hypothetical protein